MEEVWLKLPSNVPGRYYVSARCDGCAYCAGVAPQNFEFDKPSSTYFIGRQPETAKETELVLEAMEDCPVDAIIRVVISCSSAVTRN
jgi:ferredoxin